MAYSVELHPYVTAGDPNIGRAFRIACGDIASNVVPLPAMASYSVTPMSPGRWADLSARLVQTTASGQQTVAIAMGSE